MKNKKKEGDQVGKNDFDLFLFYCWQLRLETLGQLAKWKQEHNANSNAELLEEMTKAFNGEEWAKINNL